MLVDLPTNMNRQQDAFRKKHVNVSGKIFLLLLFSIWWMHVVVCDYYMLYCALFIGFDTALKYVPPYQSEYIQYMD